MYREVGGNSTANCIYNQNDINIDGAYTTYRNGRGSGAAH